MGVSPTKRMHMMAYAAIVLSGVAIACAAPSAYSTPTTTQHERTASTHAAGANDSSADTTRTALSGLPAPPTVHAKAWAVIDGTDGQLLAGDNPVAARPIASLTKIMTALIVVERTQGDESVRVSKRAEQAGDGSEIGMKAGQEYPVDTLLNAMLVYSANDAAVALAEYVGNSEADFIDEMNARAKALHLSATTFTSVTGLDSDTLTTSSPSDLADLSRVAMKDPRIRAAAKLASVKVARPGDDAVTLENRNKLIGTYDGVDGVKTGFTDAAGNCLVVHWTSSATANGTGGSTTDSSQNATPPDANEPTAEEIAAGADVSLSQTPAKHHELWIVLLSEPKDPQRFVDAQALLDWATPLRQHLQFAAAGDVIATVPTAGSGTPVRVYLEHDVAGDARVGDAIVERITVPNHIAPPLRPGDTIGRYEVLVGDTVIASSDLYVNERVHTETSGHKLRRYATSWDDAAREGWNFTSDALHRFASYWGLG